MSSETDRICQYVGEDEAGIDAEYEESGVVRCSAEADVIVRRAHQMPARKTPVCLEHARWLRSDEVPIDWEQSAEIRDLPTGSDQDE